MSGVRGTGGNGLETEDEVRGEGGPHGLIHLHLIGTADDEGVTGVEVGGLYPHTVHHDANLRRKGLRFLHAMRGEDDGATAALPAHVHPDLRF